MNPVGIGGDPGRKSGIRRTAEGAAWILGRRIAGAPRNGQAIRHLLTGAPPWTDMMPERDRSPEDWPVNGILRILEDAITGGDFAAAHLIGPVRHIHKGILRFRALAWLAEDPRVRAEAEAA